MGAGVRKKKAGRRCCNGPLASPLPARSLADLAATKMLKPGVGRLHKMGRRAGPIPEPSNARVAYMLEKSQREPI
eukprot:COSAG02_NODE_54904_length_293_cov_1.067010_1_plen_74_part_01